MTGIRKRIGILGGTFDPFHNGHLMMGKAAVEEAALDELLIMPNGLPAYKEQEHHISAKCHRAAMARLACELILQSRFSDMELERKGNTYTADTLRILTKEHPDWDLFYIVGSDSLDYMDHWYHPEEIFSRAKILAVRRSTQSEQEIRRKTRLLAAKFSAEITLLKAQELTVSSTEIREKVSKGEDISELVPECIGEYIRKNRLYLPDKMPYPHS